jgi:hypothetical protein
MSTVYALKRVANKAHNASIPDTDAIIARSIFGDPAGSGGAGSLWGTGDSKTTTITIGSGSAATSITVGGGTSYTGGTYGKSSITDTFLGNLTINGSLLVNGTVTTVNATSITTQDQVLTIALSNRSTAGAAAVFAIYRGSDSGGASDALHYWNESSTRWDIGYGSTGTAGGTLPSAPSVWTDVKLNNLLMAGTSLTASGALTVSATAAALTLQTTTSGAVNLTSAGAIVATSSGTSSWANTSGGLTLSTVTSGAFTVTSAGSISQSSTSTSSYSATTTMAVTGTTALGLTASGSSDITFTGRGQAYTFNDASNTAFTAGITATSLVGAINQVYGDVGNAATIGTTWTNSSGVNAIAKGSPVYISTTANQITNAVATTDAAAAQVFGFPTAQIAISGTGSVAVEGVVSMLFKSGDTVPANGAEIFLSAAATSTTSNVTSSYVTSVCPASTGNVVQSIGFCANNNSLSGTFSSDTLLSVQIVRGSKSVV